MSRMPEAVDRRVEEMFKLPEPERLACDPRYLLREARGPDDGGSTCAMDTHPGVSLHGTSDASFECRGRLQASA